MADPIGANNAISKALGLDPAKIRKDGVTIRLTNDLGPVVTVEYFLTDENGRMFAVNNEVATELKRYQLVPLDDTDNDESDE